MPQPPKQFRLNERTKQQQNKQDRLRQRKRKYATNSRQWRAIREQQLTKQPLCESCIEHTGKITPASHVDHIDGDSWNNDDSNLQSLCHPCHSVKTVRHDGGFGNVKT